MGDYLKPLRRKFGVVTLALACVFATGWLRSLSVMDALIVCNSTKMMTSFYGTLSWAPFPFLLPSTDPVWESSPVENPSTACAPKFYYIQPVHVNQQEVHDLSKSPPGRIEYDVHIHYWAIVVPLTLLSAFLLLSKTRAHSDGPPDPLS